MPGAPRATRRSWSSPPVRRRRVSDAGELRVPPDEVMAARRRVPMSSGTPSSWPTSASWPTTPTRARRPATFESGGVTRGAPDPPGGPGRHLRAGRAGSIPLHRPHVRRTRPGGRGRRTSRCACPRPPTAGWTTPPWPRRPSPASPRCTASAAPRPSAAMAYGTATVPRVDVIAGPGNAYVAEAKRQVSGVVGVASAFAGPSEIVVVAGPGCAARVRRHRPGRPGRARSRRPGLAGDLGRDVLAAVSAEVDRIVAASPRRADLEATLASSGIACLVDGPAAAMAVANTVAPEHLQLMVADADAPACWTRCENAGAVFIGPWSPASLGDYMAGPNHVLPTNRTARFSSALRADDFRRHIHAVTVSPDALEALGPAGHHPGRDRGPAGPRRLGPPPPGRPRSRRLGAAARALDDERPPAHPARPRPQRGLPLAPGRGRGAPQHQRVARSRRPRSGARTFWPRWPRCRSTATPTDRPPSCGPPSPPCTASRPKRSSAPTGPTRCCSACCWPTAGRAARPPCSSRPTPCTRTSAG